MAGARIDYVELPSATAHELTRGFYSKAFGWSFTDFGPDYSAMTTGDVDAVT
jgi:predicted enzyme related to lactoylglutathione lyase